MLAALSLDWTAVSIAIASLIIGAFGWFVRQMHIDNKTRLERIDESLQPLAVITERVTMLNDTVKDHVKLLPDLKTDVAIIKEKQEQHGTKIETINDEVSRLREWRHDVSNILHAEAIDRHARHGTDRTG